jgi:adenylate cyclase class 1
MAKPVDLRDGIGRKELRLIRRRFLGLQRERLRRIEAELTPGQRDYINLLPLLFHINHPVLPGFVGSETPAGVVDYSPSKAVLRTARKISRSFSYKKRARRRYPIFGLFIMGSIGSIAHTSGSDFDVWLCYDPKLTPEQLNALHEKRIKLEKWAKELALEVHIFVMDVDTFRQGSRDALSRESSGTTQRHLLLEEFYRTGILLAGRYPIWWLVPPEEENNYHNYVQMLLERRFVDPRDCLDFGGLENTPADEFFGSAHWQLYKGIEAPYKALLKLLLIEAYSRDFPDIRWLCQTTKESLYSGNLNVNELDAYLLLYRRVEQYLLEREQYERLELARRCFYFKTEQTLSRAQVRKTEKWQREFLRTLVQEWGWDKARLISLDTRNNWKIDQVLEERNTLVRELTRSYRVLTEFSRTHASSGQIDPEELNLLGRKLFTALEKQPGKIDSINPGISRNLVEKYLSLHFSHRSEGGELWTLYRGEVNEEATSAAQPVKTTASLLEILAWIHLNGLANRGTVIALFPEDTPVTPKELHSLLNSLRRNYTFSHPQRVSMKSLAGPAHATSCTLFVNTGTDPMAHLSKEGKQLTSDRSDPLSFGSNHRCLAQSLDTVLTTSWGEVLLTRQQGTRGLAESLCYYLRQTLQINPGSPAPEVKAFGFASVRATSIAQRVAQLFNDVCHHMGPLGSGPESRYLFRADDDFYLIQKHADDFGYLTFETQEELLEKLAQPQPCFRPTVLDQELLEETPLPSVLQQNREDSIQLFYYRGKGEITLYVLDEQGALFTQIVRGGKEQHLLDRQQRFFNDLNMLRGLRSEQHRHQQILSTPEYFQLKRSHDEGWEVEQRSPPRSQIAEEYLDVRLITEGLDLHHSPHLLICGEREFSSLEFGEALFHEAARHIVRQRGDRDPYPIYLTGLQFSSASPEADWSTIELLNLKKRLERRLNQALDEIISP